MNVGDKVRVARDSHLLVVSGTIEKIERFTGETTYYDPAQLDNYFVRHFDNSGGWYALRDLSQPGSRTKRRDKEMNPTELKYNVEQGQDRYFFTRDTMKFFGDTMRNYGVRDGGIFTTHWNDEGNYCEDIAYNFEVWELYRKHPVKSGLTSSAYFDKLTFRRVFKEVNKQ